MRWLGQLWSVRWQAPHQLTRPLVRCLAAGMACLPMWPGSWAWLSILPQISRWLHDTWSLQDSVDLVCCMPEAAVKSLQALHVLSVDHRWYLKGLHWQAMVFCRMSPG